MNRTGVPIDPDSVISVTVRHVPRDEWRAFGVAARESGRTASGMIRWLIRSTAGRGEVGQPATVERRATVA